MLLSLLRKYYSHLLFLISVLVLSRVLLLNFYPDFSNYYYGAKLAFSGGNPYMGDYHFFSQYLYPPIFTILFFPFTFFTFQIAEKIWTVLSLSAFFVTIYLIFKLLKEDIFKTQNLLLFGIILLTFFPTKFTLGMGQANMFIFLLFALSIYSYHLDRKTISGFFLAFSILLKVFPVFLILFFIINKKWKILVAFAIFSCVFLAATYFIVGGNINIYFVKNVLPSLLSGWKTDYYNQALTGFIGRATNNLQIRIFFKIILSAIIFLITLFSFFKKTKSELTNLKIGIAISASLLINAFSWQHHFVWILFPLFATLFYIKKNHFQISSYALLLLSYILIAWNFPNPAGIPVILRSHVFYGGLILWGFDICLVCKSGFKTAKSIER
ncbi:MAG TPA: glycosyltransferase family 87 protein [Patescibacteria group bacterium]|nr:glycosyltransferase family 87 protein [Patescibacteria group bacterium]